MTEYQPITPSHMRTVPLSSPPPPIHIMINQTKLVNDWLLTNPDIEKKGHFMNRYAPDGNGGQKRKTTTEWYLISEEIARAASKDHETTLELDSSWWWGLSKEGKSILNFMTTYNTMLIF